MVIRPELSLDDAWRITYALASYHDVLSDTLSSRLRVRGNDSACERIRAGLVATDRQIASMREAIARATAQTEDTNGD